jgi:hypothetical protein
MKQKESTTNLNLHAGTIIDLCWVVEGLRIVSPQRDVMTATSGHGSCSDGLVLVMSSRRVDEAITGTLEIQHQTAAKHLRQNQGEVRWAGM